ncbi:MAG: DUF4392 domain-containing protein [Gemmataceae bacterium]
MLAVVTGFFIPAAGLGETDGPPGAVDLARTRAELNIRVQIATDPFCVPAVRAGLERTGRLDAVPVVTLPDTPTPADRADPAGWWERAGGVRPTHLLAIERVGPAADGRCYSMRGIDITERMRDAAWLFKVDIPTTGIGDGGNEIGMGKLPAERIAAHIPQGDRIACRVATDWLLVVGVSNWGAYALAAGVAVRRGYVPPAKWFDADEERAILTAMVECGPLVDGVTGQRTATVDGLSWDAYVAPLVHIGDRERT